MSQGNQFYQYGYDHYLKAPKKPQKVTGATSSRQTGIRTRIGRQMRSPAVATVALLAAAVLFVGVIISTYPSDDNVQQPIPIVKADLRPIKKAPVERGGMDIPHRNSTILAQVGRPSVQGSKERIESLLSRPPSQESLMSKEELIAQSMAQGEDTPPVSEPNEIQKVAEIPGLLEPKSPQVTVVSEDIAMSERKEVVLQDIPIKTLQSDKKLEVPNPESILQKIGSSENDDANKDVSAFAVEVASAAMKSKPAFVQKSAPSEMHAAATSPETLAFVRNVLNKEDNSSVAEQVQKIETAAGAARTAAVAATGDYFVQLASITNAAMAAGEFKKMQAKYNALVSSNFRVQEAALANGTFYRIQAGPMSKVDADRVCASLKAQGKPGGCLVVK